MSVFGTASAKRDQVSFQRTYNAAKWPSLADPKSQYVKSLGPSAMPYPVVFLLNKEGRVVWASGTGSEAFARRCGTQLKQLIGTTPTERSGAGDRPR